MGSLPRSKRTTIEDLSDLKSRDGADALLQTIGQSGLMIRLDERGAFDQASSWVFREGARPSGLRAKTNDPKPDIWTELGGDELSTDDDPEVTEEITDELGLGFPVPPTRGAATVYLLPEASSDLELALGRSADSTVQIDEQSVSRQHAVLELGQNSQGLLVRDLHSRNGVMVRGRRIAAEGHMKVRPGDTVAFGDVVFLYLSAQQFVKNLKIFTD